MYKSIICTSIFFQEQQNQQKMIENGGHLTPVASPHQIIQRQQHIVGGQATNDTAFPGGPLRHSYTIAAPGQETHTILTTISTNEIKEPKQVE